LSVATVSVINKYDADSSKVYKIKGFG